MMTTNGPSMAAPTPSLILIDSRSRFRKSCSTLSRSSSPMTACLYSNHPFWGFGSAAMLIHQVKTLIGVWFEFVRSVIRSLGLIRSLFFGEMRQKIKSAFSDLAHVVPAGATIRPFLSAPVDPTRPRLDDDAFVSTESAPLQLVGFWVPFFQVADATAIRWGRLLCP